MPPVKQNLAIYRGDKFSFTFSIKDGNGNYVPKTGYTPKAEMRTTADDAAVAAEFTASLLDQTAAPGAVNIMLTAAETAALAPGKYVWDIQLTNDGDAEDVTTYLYGDVTVTGDVTKP